MPFVAAGGGLLAGAVWVGCGLAGTGTSPSDGGTPPDVIAVPDAANDVEQGRDAPEDRGQGMDDSGMTCVCIPPLPATWTYVTFSRDGASAPCPMGFGPGTAKTYEGAAGGAATCACGNCAAPSAVSCTVASVTLDHGNNTSCSGSQTNKVLTPTGNACSTAGAGYAIAGGDDFVKATSGAATFAATCGAPGAPVTSSKPPLTYTHQGRTCASPQTFPPSSGCGATDVCAPTLPMGDEICVQRDGDVACDQPGWMGYKALVSDAPATDTRGCENGTCACGPTGNCAAGQMQVWNASSTCSGAASSTFPVDANCAMRGGIKGINLDSFKYVGNPQNAACTKSGAATASGKVTPGGTVRTICCRT
jgi:hypothetical protein